MDPLRFLNSSFIGKEVKSMNIRKIRIAIHRKKLMNAVVNYNKGIINFDEYRSIQLKEYYILQELEKVDLSNLIRGLEVREDE